MYGRLAPPPQQKKPGSGDPPTVQQQACARPRILRLCPDRRTADLEMYGARGGGSVFPDHPSRSNLPAHKRTGARGRFGGISLIHWISAEYKSLGPNTGFGNRIFPPTHAPCRASTPLFEGPHAAVPEPKANVMPSLKQYKHYGNLIFIYIVYIFTCIFL